MRRCGLPGTNDWKSSSHPRTSSISQIRLRRQRFSPTALRPATSNSLGEPTQAAEHRTKAQPARGGMKNARQRQKKHAEPLGNGGTPQYLQQNGKNGEKPKPGKEEPSSRPKRTLGQPSLLSWTQTTNQKCGPLSETWLGTDPTPLPPARPSSLVATLFKRPRRKPPCS